MFVKNKPTLSTCITKLFVTTKEERTKSDKMATNSYRCFHWFCFWFFSLYLEIFLVYNRHVTETKHQRAFNE